MPLAVSIALVFLISCGGPVAQDGVDGRSPKCSVVKRTDGTFLICKNPDGTAAEAEIEAGEDGESVVTEMIAACSMKSELYSVRYNVAAIGEGLKLASLSVTHLKTPKVFYQGAVLHAEGDEGYGSAEMKLSAWSAKLVGEKKAEITQVGGNPEAVVCK
jgi:ribosomal protein L36